MCSCTQMVVMSDKVQLQRQCYWCGPGADMGASTYNCVCNGLGVGTEGIFSMLADNAELRGMIDTLDGFVWSDLQQDGEMCTEEPHEVQQWEMSSSALGGKLPHASIQRRGK